MNNAATLRGKELAVAVEETVSTRFIEALAGLVKAPDSAPSEVAAQRLSAGPGKK